MISRILAPRLREAAFCPRLLSDHSPYWMTLTAPVDKPPRPWRLNPFWLSLLPDDDELVNTWKLYFTENDQSASPSAVWESFKRYMLALL